MYFSTLFASAAFLSLVNAHGIVQHITANGKTYTSPLIGASGSAGPFWLVSDNSPVADTTSSETLCGRVSGKPTSAIEVAPGTTLSFYWSSGYSNEDTIWPHNTGPIINYLAKCNGDCNSIDGSTKFFKLQQDGFVSDGVWKQADLHEGKTVSFTIPDDLEAGNYVIRHEVINLASTAEMFPACANLKVTGSGSKSLSGASTTFPGAYSASDPGLTVAGAPVYSIKNDAGYTFPGPPVIKLGQSSGSGSGSSGSGSSDTAGATPTSTTETATSTDANNGAGGPPGTSTDVSSSASSTDSSSSATETDSATSATVTSSSSAPSSTGTSGTNCAEAWTACNAQYKGTAEDQANYKCQTEYTACVAASMANSTAKRMHRRRRALFNVISH